MHIESNINEQKIKRCFSDFYRLQEENGLNIQITELDMCLPESELFDKSGNAITLDTKEKDNKMKIIERIIQDSGVQLEGISYWTATDTLSPDVQRTNTKTFIAKDFYTKFKSLQEGNIELEDLLQHPFLNKNQVNKFREIYLQDGGQQILEEMIKSRQRDVILSRGSGLYSEITREKDIPSESSISQEEQSVYTITPNQIGKKSIYTNIGKKDLARSIVDRKVEERIHPQELDPHMHTHGLNGSQGGTGDGR